MQWIFNNRCSFTPHIQCIGIQLSIAWYSNQAEFLRSMLINPTIIVRIGRAILDIQKTGSLYTSLINMAKPGVIKISGGSSSSQ